MGVGVVVQVIGHLPSHYEALVKTPVQPKIKNTDGNCILLIGLYYEVLPTIIIILIIKCILILF
jgi:hypothetical protein